MSAMHYWKCSVCGRTKPTTAMERTGDFPLCRQCVKRLREAGKNE